MSLLPLILALACRDGSPLDSGRDSTADDDTGTPGSGDWQWAPCDLVPGSGDDDAECAWVDLPLDHDDPARDVLPAMVKRRPGTGAGQLWLLHGGPGGSAVDDLASLPPGLADARPDLTLYAVDHRGIGGTGRLGCPTQEAGSSEGGEAITDEEWGPCAEEIQAAWGDDLDLVTTTASAQDLGWLIERLATPGEPVLLYGGSYGTLLALRYLQIFPSQPTGVVLDGISVPGRGFVGYDQGMDGVGLDLMTLCGQDAGCAAHFEDDPVSVAQALIGRYDTGHCPALGTNGDFVRYFLGSMLFYDKLRDMVPATVRRFDRCSADDVDVIVHLYYAVTGALGGSLGDVRPTRHPPHQARFLGRPIGQAPQTEGNTGEGFSYGLFYHVALSEMWYEPGQISEEEVDAAWRSLTMATGLETWLAPKLETWPRYPRDDRWGAIPAYEGPLLMLQGALDPATTWEPVVELAAQLDGPGQTLALFPQGAHGIVGGTTLPDGGDCGQTLLLAFLDDPQSTPDTSCVAATQGVQWGGYTEYNQYFMGTDDIWGDAAG